MSISSLARSSPSNLISSFRSAILVGVASVVAAFTGSTNAQVLYSSNFQSGNTAGWSSSQLFVDDIGRRVLGAFENQTVALSLGTQPAGQYTISFDLFTISSWDGLSSNGPDRFRAFVDATPLIDAIFANQIDAFNLMQTYSPLTPLGGPAVAAGTGAIAQNELVIVRSIVIPNFTYRPSFTIQHGGGGLMFSFQGVVTQPGRVWNGFIDEPWALDRVVVIPSPSAAALLGLGALLAARRRR